MDIKIPSKKAKKRVGMKIRRKITRNLGRA
jgi:hypothetical protein